MISEFKPYSVLGGEYTGVFNSGRKSGSGRNYVMIPETDWEYFDGDYVDGSRKTGVYNTSLGYTYSGEAEVYIVFIYKYL